MLVFRVRFQRDSAQVKVSRTPLYKLAWRISFGQ